MNNKVAQVILKLSIALVGGLLVVASYRSVAWRMAGFWEAYRGEARLPADLNPACASPRFHNVKVRIEGDYDVGSDGLPAVSVYAVMPEGPGQPPTLVRSCLIPLPYTRSYSSITCDPYSFGTVGVRNISCKVWVDGELQPGCEGWVMPPGVSPVLPPDPVPAAVLPLTEGYFMLVAVVWVARRSRRASRLSSMSEG